MQSALRENLTIDIISDVICPWCYIGKRRLEAALSQLTAHEPAVRPLVSWHPFQLNPDLPREGISRRTYLNAKFGGADRADKIYERVRAVGASVGIPFAFERIVHQPNTRDAHRLVSWVQRHGDADELVELLFRAYFVDGRSIGEHEVLVAIAGEAGLDIDGARALLAAEEGSDVIAAMDRRVRQLGVDGVPFFIFNESVAVAGAQEPGTLLAAIHNARTVTNDAE